MTPQFDLYQFQKIRNKLIHPVWFRWFLFWRLPMGFLSGMRIGELDQKHCVVHLKYSWLIKNPFRSTFWAVMGMAAEMSTGALLLAYTYQQKPVVSFILTGNTATFVAKAKGRMRFVCRSGEEVEKAASGAMGDRDKWEVSLPVDCLDAQGKKLARFTFTWVIQQRE